MKLLFYLFLIIVVYTSCTSSKKHGDKEYYYQQLSSEIECSTRPEASISSNDTTFAIDSKSNLISINNNVIPKKKIRKVSVDNNISVQKQNLLTSINKNHVKKDRIIVDKQSIFWKIGNVLVKAGLILLSIFGGVFISISGGGASIYLGGFVIGLAVLALSGMFFLLAIITSYMKEKSTPVENPNEI